MKWNRFTIKTKTDAEDMIICTLAEIGVEGAEIQDHQPLTEEDKAQMFVDIMPEGPEDDGVAYLNFYLEEDADKDVILRDVRNALEELRTFMDIGEGTIEESQTEDKDWINNWKEFFHAFTIDETVEEGAAQNRSILIKPTWEELTAEDEGKILIEIDPGVSFGTGKHETTQLCIKQLMKYMKEGDEVLDLGCGSGILSIVSLKLGAKHVTGTDIDDACMTSTYENMEVNHLDRELGTFYVGNLIDDVELQEKVGEEKYDIVVANILADVIIPMAPVIPARMKKGTILITSGIIDFKENEVKEALEAAGLEIVEITHQGEWVSITARK